MTPSALTLPDTGVRTPDIRVSIRFKNNLLYRSIHSRFASIKEFADLAGLHPVTVYQLLNMSRSPISRAKRVAGTREVLPGVYSTKTSEAVCAALSCSFHAVFPEHLWPARKSSFTLEIDSSDMVQYLDTERPLLLFDTGTQEDDVINAELSTRLNQVLSTIPPRERHVLEVRYGLNGNPPHTLTQCESKFGITRARIQKIEARALRRLRLPVRSRQIAEFTQ